MERQGNYFLSVLALTCFFLQLGMVARGLFHLLPVLNFVVNSNAIENGDSCSRSCLSWLLQSHILCNLHDVDIKIDIKPDMQIFKCSLTLDL